MARKKAKKAKARTPKKVARTVTRKAPKRPARKPVRKPAKAKAPTRKALKTKATTRKKARPAARKAVKKPVKKTVKKAVKKAARKAAKKPVVKRQAKALPPVPARLMRERKRLPEIELEDAFVGTGEDARLLQSARSGHDELRAELNKHTESSLELTAGDVDANWQDAYAIGDEAPGGDSPTPDQDRVDDIGKALGVQYDDDEELMGGAEIEERDAHRWELDPKSKDDDEI